MEKLCSCTLNHQCMNCRSIEVWERLKDPNYYGAQVSITSSINSFQTGRNSSTQFSKHEPLES